MARPVRKSQMKEVPLSEVKDDLARLLREAEKQEIVITRHGKPAGVLIGFESQPTLTSPISDRVRDTLAAVTGAVRALENPVQSHGDADEIHGDGEGNQGF